MTLILTISKNDHLNWILYPGGSNIGITHKSIIADNGAW